MIFHSATKTNTITLNTFAAVCRRPQPRLLGNAHNFPDNLHRLLRHLLLPHPYHLLLRLHNGLDGARELRARRYGLSGGCGCERTVRGKEGVWGKDALPVEFVCSRCEEYD